MATCRSGKCESEGRPCWQGMCRKHHISFKLRQGHEIGRIPAAPVVDHINCLRAAGMGHRLIAEDAGISPSTVRRIHKQEFIYRETAKRLLAVELRSKGLISALGCTRRLRALQAIGYSQQELAQRLGYTQCHVSALILEKRIVVTPRVAARIAKLFSELEITPGPSKQSIRLAERKGWSPPLAWDEDAIDDPNALPDAGYKKSRADFFEDYQEMRDMGMSDAHIADRLGIQRDSLMERLRRHRKAAA